MSNTDQKQLGKLLWDIADELRGAMNADDFRDYMLAFLFLRYLSDNYEEAARAELRGELPDADDVGNGGRTPLLVWYQKHGDDGGVDDDEADQPEATVGFEANMRRKVHYVIKPRHLWTSIYHLARNEDDDLLTRLDETFKYIENRSFQNAFGGLFSEINLYSEKLGKGRPARNKKLCAIVKKIGDGLEAMSADRDDLGDAYEYLLGEFAAGSGKKAGEFYTPQRISDILSRIVTLDAQNPAMGERQHLEQVYDFACGSGSLLLNVRHRVKKDGGTIGKIFGQEKNVTTYNLARMNMLLHGVKDRQFEIFHGDTLTNDWPMLQEQIGGGERPRFDAIVANPPFSYRWTPTESLGEDPRFKSHGLAPKSAADFAFLLHGLHYLADDGTMAIILPHGVLFRGGREAKIRKQLLADNRIDTVIGLPANLFYSTGIPVCVLVLKKCKRPDDVLFINAEKHFDKGKRQNHLNAGHIDRIVETYIERPAEVTRYARRVSMAEIEANDSNLNISRYVSTAEPEEQIDLGEVHAALVDIDKQIKDAAAQHNGYLKELGLSDIP
ncbi:MAG: type I restriction-modification system subunit M [Planctomycetota bacterium]